MGARPVRNNDFVLREAASRMMRFQMMGAVAMLLLAIDLGGCGQLLGIGAGNLHYPRTLFAVVLASQAVFRTVPEFEVGRQHFGCSQGSTMLPAQTPKGLVGDPSHRGQHHTRIQCIRADIDHGIQGNLERGHDTRFAAWTVGA